MELMSDWRDHEEWRPYPRNPTYEASDRGRVRNSRTGRVLQQRLNPNGYMKVGHDPVMYPHRMVAEAFHGPAPEGYEATHHDGEPSHNCATNIVWKDRKGNAADAARHGRVGKVTPSQVRAIRQAHAAGESIQSLAERYPVKPPQISRIVRRKSRRNVADTRDVPPPTTQVIVRCMTCGRRSARDAWDVIPTQCRHAALASECA